MFFLLCSFFAFAGFFGSVLFNCHHHLNLFCALRLNTDIYHLDSRRRRGKKERAYLFQRRRRQLRSLLSLPPLSLLACFFCFLSLSFSRYTHGINGKTKVVGLSLLWVSWKGRKSTRARLHFFAGRGSSFPSTRSVVFRSKTKKQFLLSLSLTR